MVGNVRGNIWERNCTGIVKNRRSDDEGELYRNRLTNQCNDLWEKSMVQCIALELWKIGKVMMALKITNVDIHI